MQGGGTLAHFVTIFDVLIMVDWNFQFLYFRGIFCVFVQRVSKGDGRQAPLLSIQPQQLIARRREVCWQALQNTML